ncbi:GAK system CofD-like protein [Terasakiella sp. SH-1]|uniref:GAK system CofD-like protein n=1 Tax=Terasakiella sp. SH-1 TaxID=2560057 RepID=UPI00107492FC|nr:GAK system CofD-like protein [Terasakiella sp. SH-1]
MKKTVVSRTVTVPDIMRISRYEKAPEYGPRVLFFSGGTALTQTSRVLKKFTHNSIHLVTPFDSGGSSAILRKAFHMPAIGDMRSRMMALADESISGNPEIFQLFSHRLPKEAKKKELFVQLKAMADGKDARVAAIKNPMRKLITNHLSMFVEHMPDDFDLKGASIGNLILAAGYLHHNHKLDPVVFMFTKLVNVLGQVTPIVNDNLHLAVKLENGDTVCGQHMITGKEVEELASPIKEFFLVDNLKKPVKAQAILQKKKKKMISKADLICYPPGSFYSSIMANLLPKGVGQAISEKQCPKVYVPSLGNDPERIGLPVDQSIFRLLDLLKQDTGRECPSSSLLTHVFIDSENGESLKPATKAKLRSEGIDVIDRRLITPQTTPYYDPQLLVMALLSLA